MSRRTMTPRRRASFSYRNLIASRPKEMQQKIQQLNDEEVIQLYRHWYFPGARRAQIPPPGDWRVWLLLAGRGFGKTRTGAEFVRACVKERLARRIALVAP